MKISVIGRHPSLEYGFNGLMSMNWLRGFQKHGCDVELLLPESSVHNTANLLARRGFKSVDDLPRWGCNFDIRLISSGAEIGKDADVIIWQSYRPEEHPLFLDVRRNGYFITKNLPRNLSGNPAADQRKIVNWMTQFDLVALSLLCDYQEASSLARDSHRFAYVPRGFDASLLTGANRSGAPTLGFDKAVKADDGGAQAISHILSAATRLSETYPDIHYLSLGQAIESIGSERIPMLPFQDFYDRFVNRLWIYLPIDFRFSVHGTRLVTDELGKRRFLGLYENQIIEVQMAGGLIVVRRDDIPEEVIMLPDVSIVDTYEDIDAIVEKVAGHIDNFEDRSRVTREMISKTHTYENSTRLYLDAINRTLRGQ